MPEIPTELWMLLDEPQDGEGDPGWVLSIDAAPDPGGQTYLVAFSEEEALAAASHQNEMYFLNCRPVRVK